MWREDRAEYLRNNRDYTCLLDEDEAARQEQQQERRRNSTSGSKRETSKASADVSLERLEYLDRRQRLKELERQKLKGKSGSRPLLHHDVPETLPTAQDPDKRLHSKNHSFGSFFGPSEPIVAKRIIDEAAAREVTRMVAARAAKQAQADQNALKKASAASSRPGSKSSATVAHKSGDRQVPKAPKPVSEALLKVKKLKEARDYSFLMSDAPDEVPTKKLLTTLKPAMESRLESPKQLTSNSKIRDLVQSSRDSRPPSKSSKHASASVSKVPSSSRLPQQIQARQSLKLQQERPKPNPRLQSPAPQLKPPVSSKLPVRNGKAGPSHEALVLDRFKKPESSRAPSKLPPSKVTSGSGQQKPVERKIVEGRQGANRNSTGAINGSERNRLSNQHKVSASGQAPVVQRKDTYARPSNKPRPASAAELRQQSEHRRQSVPEKQTKVPAKATPITTSKFKRPDTQRRWQSEDVESSDSFISDEDEADTRGYSGVSSMIREMFRYNPNKYRDMDDEDDRNMEVGFSKIQAEERRSAKIAREEDEREQELIEAEERAERARKAKKRKLR
ncbi:hypothetical protein CY35_16G100400 [Sphagnum magellanicum]|nr:hypothetical protein CY35_16G100400 [Sphagnum magellanicum]KAH9538323.1 hypothetical protein CY35_16G100400 [Sphagnum magellanicum]KAH9538324.1 hypothetical protein CY35_16G100400 [Sphagnum magellanicum]